MPDDDTTKRENKAKEVRLRRMAERHRLELRRSRVRDPHAPTFGLYFLYKLAPPKKWRLITAPEGLTLDEIENILTNKGETQ
jgi:hypothetical protein